MAKRHEFRPGDWESIAFRLDEIISAHTGEDPFEEALKLLVAKLAHEITTLPTEDLLASCSEKKAPAAINGLLARAADEWPGILEAGATTGLSGPELLRCATVLREAGLLGENLVGLDAIFEFISSKASKGQKGQQARERSRDRSTRPSR